MNIWTNEEINIIKNTYIKYGLARTQLLLPNRTKLAIYRKAKKLKICFPKILFKYDKNNLSKVVSESKNIKEVLEKINSKNGCGNRKTLKKYLSLYQISINHFETRKEHYKRTLLKNNLKNKIPLNRILILNSMYTSTSSLKVRLYKENIKKRECEICGQNEIWRNQKIGLILDHINGINNDNRIENLRILCPNCNAAQDTFCRGIRKRKMKKSSKEINEVYAQKSLKQRKILRPTIEQLKHDIKELGYSGAGRKYKVSDNTIRKWEKINFKYNI